MSSYEAPTPPKTPKDGIQMEYRDLPPGNERTKEQKEFALSLNYFTNGAKYNPMAIIKKCKKPKLMFSGTNDRFYSPKEIEEIYESVPEPKMLHELNTDHSYRRHPEIVAEVNNVISEFLSKYLK